MAAASTLQYGRQKKSVYGKAGNSSWNTTNFFDDSDDELAAAAPASTAKALPAQRSGSVKASYSVQKTEAKRAASPRVTKVRKGKQDTFEVPSSDEEPSPPPKVVQRPVFRSNKRQLVDDHTDREAKLASWEQARVREVANEDNAYKKTSQLSAASPDNQLRANLVSAVRPIAQPARSAPAEPAFLTISDDTGKLSSAAARLAARRRVAQPNTPSDNELVKGSNSKRSPVKAASEATPRKRARTADTSRASSVDVVMVDDAMLPHCDASDTGRNGGGPDVFDFPDSSADESSKPRPRSRSPKITKKPARKIQPTSSSSKPTPRKGLSAPARLVEMLPTDSDMTEPSTASPPGSASRAATPQQPSTPPSNRRSSPETAIKTRGNMTPKQAQLWNRLLPGDAVAPSPSALAMKDLTISGPKVPSSAGPSASKRPVKSQSDVVRRRTRLVDRLKASAESSSGDESIDSSSDSEDVDIAEASDAAMPTKPPLPRAVSTQSRAESGSTSQSQNRSQLTAVASAGLKRTYASQRSHLAEDNLEDDIMAGLMGDTSKQPAARTNASGRSQARSNKDAFDLEDSDSEAAGTGAIRTIHELRAAGRHIRGAEDIEQLLEDIENHSTTHKSSRRSALIELATKLADKNFASRFIGQGFDVRLARQCGTSQDDVAGFILATALVLLLAADPPEHTSRTLRDNAAASWLGSLLSSTKEISKVAKDRQYNMARASQTALVQLAQLAQAQQSLWNEGLSTVISTRTVALKALDLLVSRCRRVGDKSELVTPDHLPLVLPESQPMNDAQLDTSLAISVLESLSTASLTLAWDSNLLQRIAQTLIASDASTPQRRHTLFLALRLCLNLTTDNPRNCDLLANERSVQYLLQTVLDGFTALNTETEEETRTLALDILVLALGILINLFEHSTQARTHATATSTPLITSLVSTFTTGQNRIADAESVAESISNVALGYLAVVLANLCQDTEARRGVRDALPGKRLSMVGDAVEEFVLFHQQVDGMSSFEGEEGQAVWGGFTEKLRGVLERVRMVEGEGEAMEE